MENKKDIKNIEGKNQVSKEGKNSCAIKNPILIASALLMLGLFAVGIYIGNGIFKATNQRIVVVKGLAEREVKADTAIWDINISKVGDDLIKVQAGVDSDLDKMKKWMVGAGFSEDEIQYRRVSVRDKFAGYSVEAFQKMAADNALAGNKSMDRYVIETGLVVRSNNVDLVDKISRKMGELVKQGITITENYAGPSYIFNGLNDVKVDMIEIATKNARQAADQFARDADADLGKIKSANQGVFSIEGRDAKNQWDDEKQYIDKKVRVVATITYYLR